MKIVFQRMLAAILFVCILIPFSACGGDTPDDPMTETTEAETTIAETTTEAERKEPTAYEYLEKKDYDGYAFRIIAPTSQTRYFPNTVVPEETTGDVIFDAAYERNSAVADYFNIQIQYVDGVNRTTAQTMALNAVQTEEDLFDMTHMTMNTTGILLTDGIYMDVSELPNLHTDMPWYSQRINDSMTFGNKMKVFASDFNCTVLSCTYGIFVNQSMAYETYQIPDLHQVVFDGRWTFDRMNQYVKLATMDLNGDGAMTAEDQYGYTFFGQDYTPVMLQYGMGQFTTKLNEQGLPELILNSERMAAIAEQVNALYNGPDTLFHANGLVTPTSFAEKHALFLNCIIMHAPNYMRNMEDDYGILPMPKYDENQEEYYTSVAPDSAMIQGVPITVKDPAMVSAIIDLLSYEGGQKVIPAFFETSMKRKYSSDENSSAVFDILRDSTVVDFGLIFDNGVGMANLLAKCVMSNSDAFASQYASIEAKTNAQYQSVIDSLLQ